MALDDDIAGGFSNYYNPAFGLMAIQQPEMFVQHLAAKGVPPPADFPEDFSHQDAHMLMARNDTANAWKNMSPSQRREAEAVNNGTWRPRPDMVEGQQAPQPPAASPSAPPPQGAAPPEGTTRYNFQPLNSEGQSVTLPNRVRPTTPGLGSQLLPSSLSSYLDPITGQEINAPDAATPEDAARQARPPVNAPPTAPEEPPPGRQGISPISGGPPPIKDSTPWSTVPSTPLPRPRPLNDGSSPLAPGDTASTAGGAPAPEGTTEEQQGGLSQTDPSAKNPSPNSPAPKKAKDDSIDSFGKALAGLSAMKTPQAVFPHPGNLPHPSNQISRSTLPTELLKELSSIGHPQQSLRLGQAIRGR